VVADAFSRLVEHHPQDKVAASAQLIALVITGNDTPSEQGLHDEDDRSVTIEPAIDAGLRVKIKEVHNSVSGHFGVEYTRKVLIDKGIGSEGLRRAITKFVRDCPVCQLRFVLNRQIVTHRYTTAWYTPMEVLNIDTIGPLSNDSSEKYILVIIDCFTWFVELYPIEDTSATLCARDLLSHVSRYGTPMTIRSDRGTQFVNAVNNQLLSLLQIEHELSLAYSKEHNAIVKRANEEVMRHLTAIMFDKRVNSAWSSEYLQLVQGIMNAKVHDTIGVSSAELLFG
jgi:hypothetical protein